MRPRAPFSKSISALTKSPTASEKSATPCGPRRAPVSGERDRTYRQDEFRARSRRRLEHDGRRGASSRSHLAEIVVAHIGVHVQYAAKCSTVERRRIFFHRGFVSSLMADTKHAAGLFACRQDPLCTGRRKRERFLTKNLLAGFERSDGHFFVQKVRGHDRNRFKMVRRTRPVVVYEVQLVGGGKRRRHLYVDVASGNDPEAWALCKAGHDCLPHQPSPTIPIRIITRVPLCFLAPTMLVKSPMRNGHSS